MPQFDPTTFPTQLFWLVVTFVALYVLMVYVALPRVTEVLDARRERVDHDLEAAEKLRAEAEAALAAYEKTMADSRNQAQAALRKAHEEIVADSAARQAELAKTLAERTKAAEARIGQAAQAALGDVRRIAADAAAAAAGKLIGVSVAPAEAEAAVAKAMAERK
jgi:F-type H+-transporting ATPase subunit b